MDLSVWYKYHVNIVVRSVSHDICLDFTKRIKSYVHAWFFLIKKLDERKSARKGEILCRDLFVVVEGSASEILVFQEALRCISHHLSSLYPGSGVEFGITLIAPQYD